MTESEENGRPAEDPLWYKDAVFYELRVRSFYDSNGDGIGDFPGLTSKLDYLQRLGVTTLWLLPFYPSPMRDGGYDISDYTDVHSDCGTLHDFRLFLREAHRRELRVVTELVLNHTSDLHPWFQLSRRAKPGDPWRDFYVWSENPDLYKEARIIFQDFEHSNWSWDPVAKAYYWHRFYSHQPDLNFDNPKVRRALLRAVDFWLAMGVDGLRLDAVPYLCERDGTNCENLPETHAVLKELRRHVDRKFRNRMLLAEANQWPEDAVAYFDQGKECHMAFHFPLMPRLYMAVRMEDRFPITDIWAQTPAIPESCQWALFLRNHDELTLEMVTEEERDFIYRAYAREPRMKVNLGIRRRLAPLMGNNRRTIELKNSLLFSLPGTPVIYYGDEIGMGDNVYLGDRDGVRTPMQWSGDRNAGFSAANPQSLILPVIIDHEYHYQTVNVEAQDSNRHSLLWWTRRLIALRRQFKAFGRGSIEFLNPENPRVLAFIRAYQEERILVVANLSRFVQYVELDLSRFKGMVPIELFGRTPFPPIGDLPYLLTLSPHAFNWFSLEQTKSAAGLKPYEVPKVETTHSWESVIRGEAHEVVDRVLPDYLPHCRWFGGKARPIKGARLAEALAVPNSSKDDTYLTFVEVQYGDGEPETYVLPLALAVGDRASEVRARGAERVMADLRLSSGRNGEAGVLYDPIGDPEFLHGLLELIDRRRRVRGRGGEAIPAQSSVYRSLRGASEAPLDARPLKAEQSNSSAAYGDRLILKLFRRLEAGVNPDLEVGRFLTERARFDHTPPVAAWLEYHAPRAEPRTLAILQGFIANQGDAWEYTRRELHQYLERAVTEKAAGAAPPNVSLVELTGQQPEAAVNEIIGAYLEAARLMGRRVAELHLALLADGDDPDFGPETYSTLYQRSMYQSMRNLTGQVFRLLRRRVASLPDNSREQARQILDCEDQVLSRFDSFLKRRITAVRIRCHGDLHLGQILYTGKDFFIIDFEGEPARPLVERRRKRSPLRDVAGTLRSFHYAAFSSVLDHVGKGTLGEKDLSVVEPWARLWQTWSSWAFLKAYLETAGSAPFIPKERGELTVLLDAFMLEKAIYELGYELNNRQDWLRIPLGGIDQILRRSSGDSK